MWLILMCAQINEAGEKKHLRGFWTHKYDENDRR